MNENVKTKLVYDAPLADLSDVVQYDVRKGAANKTYQRFKSNSASRSLIQFSINPPSESTSISRNIYIRSTVVFKINITNVAIGKIAFDYGGTDAPQSYPLNRLFNSMSLSLNNTTTSINSSEVVPALVRMLSEDFKQKNHGFTPTMADNYGDSFDAVTAENSPVSGYSRAGYNNFLLPRGCHPVNSLTVLHNIANAGTDSSLDSTSLLDTWVISVSQTFTEPILGLSPFVWGDAENQSAFLGVNNFQLVSNIDAQMSRFWSSTTTRDSGAAAPNELVKYSLSLESFEDTELLLQFLTAPISLTLPSRAVLPYSSYIAYVSQSQNATPIAARTSYQVKGSTANLSISSIQFETVPDKLLVYVRNRPVPGEYVFSTDTFLSIENVDITFANRSGILSGITQQQLYELSCKNGLKSINYPGFSGNVGSVLATPAAGGGANASVFQNVAGCGSVLVLDPTYDFSLDSPLLAASSQGQFNLQMNLTVRNNLKRAVTPEVVVIALRNGVFVTAAGQSTLTTSILNSSMVVKAMQDAPSRPIPESANMQGGGRSGGGRSGGGHSGGMSQKLSALSM